MIEQLLSGHEVKQAVSDGIELGVDGVSQQSKLKGFVREASLHLGDAMALVSAREDGRDVFREFGMVAGRVLTLSGIKHPEGKLKNPSNVQLLREILRSSMRRSEPLTPYRMEVSIGLGGSELPASIRTLAYIQPAIDILCSFDGTRLLSRPEGRVFNAHRISSALNGLDAATAKRRSEETAKLIEEYAGTFFQGVNLRLEEIDPSVDIYADLFEEDVEYLGQLFAHPPDSKELGEEERLVRVALEKLKRAARKHSNEGEDKIEAIVCGYAATHGQAFKNYGHANVPDAVVKLGGQGEAPFDVIQQNLAQRHVHNARFSNPSTEAKTQLINLRTVAGAVPPYYPEAGEITMESSPDEVPTDLNLLEKKYRTLGLMSVRDFEHLPKEVREHLPDFFRGYLARRQNV